MTNQPTITPAISIRNLATPALIAEYKAATDKYLVAEYAVDQLDLPRSEYSDAIEALEQILESH